MLQVILYQLVLPTGVNVDVMSKAVSQQNVFISFFLIKKFAGCDL